MISLHFPAISQKIKNLSASISLTATSVMLLVVTSGCVQKAQDEVQLEIKNLEATQSNGVYTVVGTTNLPESSRITVTAIRYLHSPEELGGESLNTEANINRSILDRKTAEVKQSKWQAELNLWEVAPNGNFQEVWQANQASMKLTPDSDVTFIATFDPESQWQRSQKPKVKERDPEPRKIEGKLLRFTNEGEKYVQTSQILSVSLPGGKTIPPRPQAEDVNGGWGNRYEIRPEPLTSGATVLPPIKFRQTNAPLSPSEFLR
jgi:hypothetical protein